MIRALLLCCALLLSACATSQAPLPTILPHLQTPLQLHIQRHQGEQRQDWLLIIQQEPQGLRWSMMDPLGIPQARLLLINGQWQADGLLPPNPEARELFAALLFALTPDTELRNNYPEAQRQGTHRHLEERWTVEYHSANVFDLDVTPDKDSPALSYGVSPLNNETAP
ncbi:hypothetical protein M2401_003245 [Pseudomonas sp. JUb42]|jgi:hypothetical protein|uniref:DUF3261 domain-containing protein n=1 Tax=Pseudomonas sp. JUb42 TaxID=2940611 RepID=UPI002168C349|nr:DUF3261 domain-containing protein [Pseudomonas sp. JUb42]MCS3469507.1 hypothetical protein [Pseudomonas sp. JUb42]